VSDLRTDRLLLRHWRESDLEPWAALNADPAVREHFPTVETREQSAESMALIAAALTERGWGLWALEVRDTGEFIGFTGLNPVRGLPFEGVEVGWRLARAAWGHGYAAEAARAALTYAFGVLELPEVVSFTSTTNVRSQAVMRRIGMTHDPADDFDHPRVPPGPLRRHVLYRICRPAR
jgi:RimJ/RimL family protein N-acetyltransferase